MANLDKINNQMSIGQVKTIRNNNHHLDYVEMLFSNELSAQLAPLGDAIQFDIKDNEFRLPNMSCKMERDTLRLLILCLKELYQQLESEENK